METIVLIICGLGVVFWFIGRMADKDRSEKWAETESRLNATSQLQNQTTANAAEPDEKPESQTSDDADHADEEHTPSTSEIVEHALKSIGCQPEVDKNGSVGVSYQGENFIIEFGGMYARVWDPGWASMNVEHPDMQKLREAVNAANFRFGPTVVMTKPDDEGNVSLHSRRDIMLHPTFPDSEIYIKSVLDSFFEAKAAVRDNLQTISAEQAEAQKKRRPVGFTSTPE
jgi:hypothetical protein